MFSTPKWGRLAYTLHTVELSKLMLCHNNVKTYFWTGALSTTTYRVISNAFPVLNTHPHHWEGFYSVLRHMPAVGAGCLYETFGCCLKTMDNRSRLANIFWYAELGYTIRLLNAEMHRVLVPKDVVFDYMAQ